MDSLSNAFSFLLPSSSIGKWSEVPSMKSKRYGCAAVTLGDNKLLVIGGYDGSAETSSVELFDGNEWIESKDKNNNICCSMSTRRLGCVAATLNSDECECVVVVGGHNGRKVLDSAERFNSRLNMWIKSPSPGKRFEAAAVGIGANLYLIGGHDGRSCTNRIDVFDSNFCTWETLSQPMPSRRFQCGAAVLGDNIYIVGGKKGETVVDSVEVFDVIDRRWSTLPSMTSKRKGCVAAAVDGKIFVFGGHDGTKTLKSAERYDPLTRSWTCLPPMKQSRFGSAIAVLQNKIFIIGGFDGVGGLSSVEQFTVTSSGLGRQEGETATETYSDSESPTMQGIPDELLCPITGELMDDPVVASDGHSYEREAIEEWIRRFSPNESPRSPITNGRIDRRLFPNHNLKSLCRSHAEENVK